MIREILLFVVICIVKSEEIKHGIQENRMVGVDTFHDNGMKIGKDTIISKNMNLGKRNSGKYSQVLKKDESEPDWSYSSFPKEVQIHVKQFKLNMSECLKEVQAKEKLNIQRLSPKKDSPVHGECLIACVLKRNEVIRHGKIHKDNLLVLVNKFYAKDTQLMKKLEKQIDRCIDSSIHGSGECAMAARLNDCTNHIISNSKHQIVVNY